MACIVHRSIFQSYSAMPAQRLAHHLALHDRALASPELFSAAELLSEHLARRGARTQVDLLPLGAERDLWGWSCPQLLHASRAELALVAGAQDQMLCQAPDQAASLICGAAGFAYPGKTLSVVDAGSGQLPLRSRLGSAVLLISDRTAPAVLAQATEDPAFAGLIIISDDPRWADRLGQSQQQFVFRLDAGPAEPLLTRLRDSGSATVRVAIDTQLGNDRLPLFAARLPGSDLAAERVTLVADLTADSRDIATAAHVTQLIQQAVTDGRLTPPRRTLEFVAVPRQIGAVGWLAAQRQTLPAAIITIESATRAESAIRLPWPQRASFVSDLLWTHAQTTQTPVTAEGLLAVLAANGGVAAAAGLSIDRRRIGRSAAALAATVAELADLDETSLPAMLFRSRAAAMRRIGKHTEIWQSEQLAQAIDGSKRDAQDTIWRACQRIDQVCDGERRRFLSACRFIGRSRDLQTAEAIADIERAASQLKQNLIDAVSAARGQRVSAKRKPLALEQRIESSQVSLSLPGPPPPLWGEIHRESAQRLRPYAPALVERVAALILNGLVDGPRPLLDLLLTVQHVLGEKYDTELFSATYETLAQLTWVSATDADQTSQAAT
ncbi:MAG: hypothetical protein H6707_05520 [Deltaproteobacteria bacterium]|nr:hypothetical protein [Deltaproteobacteria bacterium]